MAEPNRYRVSLSHSVQLEMAVLIRRATIFGLADRFARALRYIQERLETQPLEWGEASSKLHGMNVVLHTGFHDRIRVTYGVHKTQPTVFVQQIEPEPGHPLYRDTDTDA